MSLPILIMLIASCIFYFITYKLKRDELIKELESARCNVDGRFEAIRAISKLISVGFDTEDKILKILSDSINLLPDKKSKIFFNIEIQEFFMKLLREKSITGDQFVLVSNTLLSLEGKA